MTVRKKINAEYLRRAAQAPDIAALKKRALEQLKLIEGDFVFDIGCGPAIDTLALAKIVGTKGDVIGIDGDPDMVAAANQAAVEAGVGTYTKHLVGDAAELHYESDQADGVFCERVLQHIPWERNQAAVNEMLRVLAPGGKLVIIDTDWSTLSIATNDPPLERRIVAEHLLGFANPFSGRNLLALLRGAGGVVEDVAMEPVAIRVTYESALVLLGETLRRGIDWGRLSWPDVQNFTNELKWARDYQVWSAHLTLVMATATKGDRNG